MIKLIKRIILLLILLAIVAIYFAVTDGGDRFRWLGRHSEEAGRTIKEKLDETAETADDVKEVVEKSAEGLEKLKDFKKNLP